MEQVIYERPREKLQGRGAQFLTDDELIQLIIGSGTVRISAARLAKVVAKKMHERQATYDTLKEIKGIGNAKACQLIAALELGRRQVMNETHNLRSSKTFRVNERSLLACAKREPSRILCVWLDGTGDEIDRKFYDSIKGEHGSVLARRIFTDAVTSGARHLYVFIGKGKRMPVASTKDLAFVEALKESAKILQVRIVAIYAVTAGGESNWSNIL